MVTAELFKEAQKPKQMKTKCIVLGQENEPKKELKKIEFVKSLNQFGHLIDADYMSPKEFKNIELISKNYGDGMDLIFAYQDFRNASDEAILFLGHWNDGVV